VEGYSLTSPAATSGYPHITIPCGQVYDFVYRLIFFGLPYTEELIGLDFAYEQVSKKRSILH
jgi:amidase